MIKRKRAFLEELPIRIRKRNSDSINDFIPVDQVAKMLVAEQVPIDVLGFSNLLSCCLSECLEEFSVGGRGILVVGCIHSRIESEPEYGVLCSIKLVGYRDRVYFFIRDRDVAEIETGKIPVVFVPKSVCQFLQEKNVLKHVSLAA